MTTDCVGEASAGGVFEEDVVVVVSDFMAFVGDDMS